MKSASDRHVSSSSAGESRSRRPWRTAVVLAAGAAAWWGSLAARAESGRTPAAPGTVTVFASGLQTPRGLKFGPDGSLYVAEGGTGGATSTVGQCEQVPPPIGPYTGSADGARISRIDAHGNRTTFASGFPSSQTSADSGALVSGVADVAFLDGTLYAVLAGAGCSHGVASLPNGIARVASDGSWKLIADLSAFQKSHPVQNPEPDDFEPDGTWYGMVAVDGVLYAVEPNHGELDRITPEGRVQRVADVSASQGHVVPTAIAYHDGSFYVGNLNTFPIVEGSSKIYKISPGGQVRIVARGLTTVLGVAFDDCGRMYVLENTTGNPFPTPGTGRVVRVTKSGGLDVIASGLFLPTAMTFGPDGGLYVSNMGFGPPVGEILRIALAPTTDCADADAASWLLPSAAHVTSAASGTTLATDLTVVNPTTRDGGFAVSFLGHDRDGTAPVATKTFALAAGATVTYHDLLPSVFGLADGWGAVEVRSDVPDLVVQSRTLALAGGGSVGSTLPAFGAGDLLRTDQVATIASVDEGAGTRTNLLLANATEAEADVDIRLVTSDGKSFGPMRRPPAPERHGPGQSRRERSRSDGRGVGRVPDALERDTRRGICRGRDGDRQPHAGHESPPAPVRRRGPASPPRRARPSGSQPAVLVVESPGARGARKTRRARPRRTSSPSSRTTGSAIRAPRTNVPFLLPRSARVACTPSHVSRACRRDTDGSSIVPGIPGSRPRTTAGPVSAISVVPRTSRGASREDGTVPSSSSA